MGFANIQPLLCSARLVKSSGLHTSSMYVNLFFVISFYSLVFYFFHIQCFVLLNRVLQVDYESIEANQQQVKFVLLDGTHSPHMAHSYPI